MKKKHRITMYLNIIFKISMYLDHNFRVSLRNRILFQRLQLKLFVNRFLI